VSLSWRTRLSRSPDVTIAICDTPPLPYPRAAVRNDALFLLEKPAKKRY
jgi:hypothetical protein